MHAWKMDVMKTMAKCKIYKKKLPIILHYISLAPVYLMIFFSIKTHWTVLYLFSTVIYIITPLWTKTEIFLYSSVITTCPCYHSMSGYNTNICLYITEPESKQKINK